MNKRGLEATICGHVFHQRCLEIWFRQKWTCPTCQHPQDPRDLRNVQLNAERDIEQLKQLRAQFAELHKYILTLDKE
jgi:hypothetical protein